MIGILGLQLLSLSVEINRLFLVGRGDSGVDNVRFLTFVFSGRSDNGVDIIESLAGRGANVTDEVSISPSSEGLVRDTKPVGGVGRLESKFELLFIHWHENVNGLADKRILKGKIKGKDEIDFKDR